jgi:YegS/Rv2252/BmrU family lipid kinase
MADRENEPAGLSRRVYVVVNPVAGHASAGEIRSALERHFEGQGWSVEIYETTGEENVAELTRQACGRGFDLVVAAGGDGTVAGVVNGLVHRDVPLGILPVGTGNGLARALNIPLTLDSSLALLTGGHELLPIDAMQVGEAYYLLNVSAGISARAMRRTPPEIKRRFGMLAYVWTIVGEALGFQPRRFNLSIDGHQVEVRAAEILVSNGAPLQEDSPLLGRREDFGDGQFDIFVITARSLLDYLRILWDLIQGPANRKTDLRRLTMKECLRIEALRRPQPVQADGEVVGYTPVEVRLVPGPVRVIVPEQESIAG